MGYPITASAKDEIKAGVFMETSTTLNEFGELNISTRSWTKNPTAGAHSRAVIYLFDEAGKRLWNTDELACGVGGTVDELIPIFGKAKSDRTENYSFNVPSGFVSQARSIKIVHFDKPKTVAGYLEIINKFFDMNEQPQNPTVINTQHGPINISGGQQGVVGNDTYVEKQTFTQTNNNNQSLSEAVEEVQKILKQLSQTYPANTDMEKMALATEAIKKIEAEPHLKKRLINAAKQGGLEALKQLPGGGIVVALIEGYLEPKQSKDK